MAVDHPLRGLMKWCLGRFGRRVGLGLGGLGRLHAYTGRSLLVSDSFQILIISRRPRPGWGFRRQPAGPGRQIVSDERTD